MNKLTLKDNTMLFYFVYMWLTLPPFQLQAVVWELIFLWEQLVYSVMKKIYTFLSSYFYLINIVNRVWNPSPKLRKHPLKINTIWHLMCVINSLITQTFPLLSSSLCVLRFVWTLFVSVSRCWAADLWPPTTGRSCNRGLALIKPVFSARADC